MAIHIDGTKPLFDNLCTRGVTTGRNGYSVTMLKKFASTLAAGAGLMWFMDPHCGSARRRAARRRIDPLLGRRFGHGADQMAAPRPAAAGDPTSMTDVIDLARRSGVSGNLAVNDAGRIVCMSCASESDAEDVERLWLHRLEGASDPADSSTVSAIRCPQCGALGLLITPYGPSASAEEANVIVRMPAPISADMAPFTTSA